MTEQEMRASVAPTVDTLPELQAYIATLEAQEHDYGTCVNLVAHRACLTAGRRGLAWEAVLRQASADRQHRAAGCTPMNWCRCGLHTWGKWSEPVKVKGTLTMMNDVGDLRRVEVTRTHQERTCVQCGMYADRFVKPKLENER